MNKSKHFLDLSDMFEPTHSAYEKEDMSPIKEITYSMILCSALVALCIVILYLRLPQ